MSASLRILAAALLLGWAATGTALAEVPSICPDNFDAFAGTTAALECGCSAEAADSGTVWGMDVYMGGSSICRAARHAGVIGAGGGPVSVMPEPGRAVYPGVTRNGVISNNYGPSGASFRFASAAAPPAGAAVPAPPVSAPSQPASAAPAQEPIAQTLQERGEVALYVRFRTGSADLDPATVPILEELLAAMTASPNLNLGLVGHTDTVGTSEYNRSLSYRRADAVRSWLVNHRIDPTRMTIDGRGFDEPLADNATEAGRAMNRRVQARRLP